VCVCVCAYICIYNIHIYIYIANRFDLFLLPHVEVYPAFARPERDVIHFGAATHPGVGGGTHRRRATFERCSVFVGGVRLGVWGIVVVACVCRCRGCCSLSMCVCA